MARVLTNKFGLRFAPESTLGTKPTSGWRVLEPNNPGAFGAKPATVSRRPISSQRGRRKGVTVGLDSMVEYGSDATMDAFTDFIEGFIFAEYANKEFDLKASSGTVPPPAVAATDAFTIDAASSLLAGKMQWVTGGPFTLVFAKGYSNSANNGLHALVADVGSTDTAVETDGSLVDETPPTKASLQVAGVRSAIGDLAFTKSGSTATIVSAADITDWSTLGLMAGMYIHVGSDDGSGSRQYMFDDGSGNDVFGYARITSIDGATLNLDKLDTNLDTTDASNATLVDIMFGRFVRNVAIDADSDDEEYLERSYSFEGAFEDLEAVGTPAYEYAVGNMADEMALVIPLRDKATVEWKFVGTTSEAITTSRATGPSTAVSPLRVEAFGTANEIASLTSDIASSASDVKFKNLTIRFRNNVSAEEVLGTLGADAMNTGLFEVNIEGSMLFKNKSITAAIRNSTSCTFAAIMKNEDGAVAIDVPALTFGGGDRDFPEDKSVTVNITGEAFNDPDGTIPDVSLGVTIFPSVPTDRD